MADPTVTQADDPPYVVTLNREHAEALSALINAALACGQRLGKSEGYAQAVDDAVAVVHEMLDNASDIEMFPAVLHAFRDAHKAIAALKDRTNG